MKNISILGSTGSIGIQAADVVRRNKDKFKIVGLSTNKNIDLLYEQILEFKPQVVAVMDSDSAYRLKKRLKNNKTEVVTGLNGLMSVATLNDSQLILVSVVGISGLIPTLKAISCNKEIALANKETLVAGGEIVKKELEKSNSVMVPVDSEHSAIFQCLQGNKKESEIDKIILTASGGPFRGRTVEELNVITPEQALKHPNWNMGRKISIDSATLMNKGLEVIEAHWLFGVNYDKIDVVVHHQSIIHSMVEFIDGNIIAQLGVTDMRNPILYAFGYPERLPNITPKLDLVEVGKLTFEKPDKKTFRSLQLAYDAGSEGGTLPVVLNAANEVAVDLFLNGIIKFLDIPDIVEKSMMNHKTIKNPGIDDILETDRITRMMIYNDFKDLKVVCR